MRSLIGLGVFVLLSGSTLSHADGTLRYKSQFKLAAAFPAAVQQVVNQSADVPQEMIIRFKGDKTYSNTGKMILVSESRRQEVTAMDPADKLFATVYAKDFPGEIFATIPTMPLMLPNVQKILESIKPNVSVRKTGRTDHISGIEAEETELTISMEMPVPAGVPAGMFQSGETITIMKMVMQIWNATPAEVLRVQVLSEMASHTSKMLMPNASDGMRQLFASFPGFGDTFAAMMDQLSQSRTPCSALGQQSR